MTTDRCDFSDLLTSECGCKNCRPDLKPAPPTALETRVTTRFPASFDSKCPACGDRIREGDTIGRTIDGLYICEGCFA